MPDAPDWYNYRLQSNKSILTDMAELAVRLGSPNVYSRTGSVIWETEMENGIGCFGTGVSGLGGVVKLDSAYPLHGGYVMALIAGSTVGLSAYGFRSVAPQRRNKWGLEVGVSLLSDFNVFSIAIKRRDGVNSHDAWMQIDKTFGDITYVTDEGGVTHLMDIPDVVSAYGLVHNLKLIADFDSGEWCRIEYNEFEFDVSGTHIDVDVSGDPPSVMVYFLLQGIAAENDVALLDHVIFTIDEI